MNFMVYIVNIACLVWLSYLYFATVRLLKKAQIVVVARVEPEASIIIQASRGDSNATINSRERPKDK